MGCSAGRAVEAPSSCSPPPPRMHVGTQRLVQPATCFPLLPCIKLLRGGPCCSPAWAVNHDMQQADMLTVNPMCLCPPAVTSLSPILSRLTDRALLSSAVLTVLAGWSRLHKHKCRQHQCLRMPITIGWCCPSHAACAQWHTTACLQRARPTCC
jgi:hypothetical protein